MKPDDDAGLNAEEGGCNMAFWAAMGAVGTMMLDEAVNAGVTSDRAGLGLFAPKMPPWLD